MQINTIAYALPEATLDNETLAGLYTGWTPEKILNKTGVATRRIAAEGETAVDLAEQACRKLFDAGVAPGSVDFLLMCTQSPDYHLPSSACILQHRLGLSKACGATDFDLGCSGYVYGLAFAKGLMAAGVASNILFVTADTYTKYVHPMDKSVRTIFGDGAAATFLTASDTEKVGAFSLGTDGSGAQTLVVPTGCAREPRTAESAREETDRYGNTRSRDNLYMNGQSIYRFSLRVVPQTVDEALAKNGLSREDIDLYVFHQANTFMLEALRREMNLPQEKFYINMEDIGNTVSSTIPIALARAEAEGRLARGMKVLLAGFGVGLSWGATVVTW